MVVVFGFTVGVLAVPSGQVIFDDRQTAGSMLIREYCTSTGERLYEEQFVKYLTSSWTKASSYTWSKSNTASWSIGSGATWAVAKDVTAALNLQRTYTTSYAVEVTIPVTSPHRYSKLAFLSDYHMQFYRFHRYINGDLTYQEFGRTKTPTKDTYVVVWYKP